ACKTLALIPPDSPSFAEARFLMAEMWLAQGQIAACNEEMKALAKLPLKNGVKAAVSFWGAGR
ncbi:MAG: hypothetical protein JO102_07650, partial [Elusimicrobia bacterium]|nr:hypothetical protein [Elusimicrobiota bacterium]